MEATGKLNHLVEVRSGFALPFELFGLPALPVLGFFSFVSFFVLFLSVVVVVVVVILSQKQAFSCFC